MRLPPSYRWYGSNPPTMVFYERKTHKESWKGEESVKERFTLPSDKVRRELCWDVGLWHWPRRRSGISDERGCRCREPHSV